MKKLKEFKDLTQVAQNTIKHYRQTWEKLAKKNDWYSEPFYIQVWINENQDVLDVVAHKGLTKDILIIDDEYAE